MRVSGENLKIKAGELTVNYDDNGPVYAPAVVFIHGTPFNKSIWDLQAEVLKSNYRVITYDLRGHGRTTGGINTDFSIDLLTSDLLKFMDALELDKVILCGISLGGYIALNAVEKYAERFNGLILTSTQCSADDNETVLEREGQITMLKQHGMERYSDEIMRYLFAPTSFTTRREEIRSAGRMIMETNAESVIKSMQAISSRRETCSNLWNLSLPVLIVAGKEDAITPPDAARFMRDNITGSVLHVIEYAGHLVNLENTHEYNEVFKKFVDRVCQKKHLSRHCSGETKSTEKKDALSK